MAHDWKDQLSNISIVKTKPAPREFIVTMKPIVTFDGPGVTYGPYDDYQQAENTMRAVIRYATAWADVQIMDQHGRLVISAKINDKGQFKKQA